MAAAEELNIALTPELATDVRQAVASGEYASTSEVISDALRAWKEQRHSQAVAVKDLQRLWREGVNSGESKVFDGEAIKNRGRERLAQVKATGS
ncbi:MAG: type II toxin-antitoxin system ParD family antitoxin [Caulobacteraceae bacterium]